MNARSLLSIVAILGLFSRKKKEPQSPNEGGEKGFIRCPACNKVMHSTLARCPYCSAFLEVRCPNCDRTTNRTFKDCPYCGSSLNKAT